MFSLVDLFLSCVIGDEVRRRAWVRLVSALFLFVGLIGLAGAAGLIPLDLEPVRNSLGGFGRQLVYWRTLTIIAVAWYIALFPLGIYFRLRGAPNGKLD